MSKELHIALQNAIGDLGTDVLKSPFLVNILQDYGAFEVNDKSPWANKKTKLTCVNFCNKLHYIKMRIMICSHNDNRNRIILTLAVVILLLSIVLTALSGFCNLSMDYNSIEACVSVLSVAVTLVIGYQIINVLEIKSEMKSQKERIEQKHREMQVVLDRKEKEVDAWIKDIREKMEVQRNQVEEQLQSIAKQKIVLDQLLAKRSINRPYEFWQAMSYQADAITTAIENNMIESISLCKELLEYVLIASDMVWETDNSAYIEKINDSRKLVDKSPNRPFLFLLNIVDDALNLARKSLITDRKEIDVEEKKCMGKKFNETASIVKAGWH